MNLPLIVEGDAVIRFADLEAAVVVRPHARRAAVDRRCRGSLDNTSANAVDAALVEGHDERRHRGVVRNEITSNQFVAERATANVRRRRPT